MGAGLMVLPESLRSKLGNEAANDLVGVLNSVAATTHERTVEVVIERFERRLVEEIAAVKSLIAETNAKIDAKIAEAKADVIKWMFVFWLGQTATVLAVVKFMQ